MMKTDSNPKSNKEPKDGKSKKARPQISPPKEYVWVNPKKAKRFRFDFGYSKKQNKEEYLNVKREKNMLEKALEALHRFFN